jgi:predicted esterase
VIRTESISVRRTALIATLGPEPGPQVQQLWYILHGQAMRAEAFLESASVLDNGSRLLVAPEALNRHYLGEVGPVSEIGATWMTKSQRESEIRDYVAYLDDLHEMMSKRFGGALPPVTVLGFSQGGATAVRWAALGKVRLSRLVVWASSLPPDVDFRALAARQPGARYTYVSGTKDKWITPKVLEAQHAMLRDAGVAFDAVSFEGGHRLDDATLGSLASA